MVGDTIGSGSPARLPGEILGGLQQDLAFLLQLADLLPQSCVLGLQRCRRLGRFCVRRPRGRLAPAARTQFRSVSGLIPRSAATDLIVASGRDSYSATASALNSGG